jgi:MoaA/NifB/PqqE/SkfB family radical SAM enzyme
VSNENILFSALVELTYRCNLACYFCYNDVGLKGTPMTTEEYFRFFEDLRDMQVMNLVLTGGEPLAHPDFMRLGKKARELGFVVRLKSNGHSLNREKALLIKSEIAPFIIEVSLHGARPETHDRQTRVAGSHDRLLTNLRGMLDLGIRTKLNCTLTTWNENELEEMFELADTLGVRLQVTPDVTPRDNGDWDVLSVAASPEGLQRLFRSQLARSKAAGKPTREVSFQADEVPAPTGKHCGAGSSGVAVDPYGNVYPCVQWRRPVGNLHQKSIKDIWAHSSGLEEVRGLTTEAKQFVAGFGKKGRAMGFCPALAVMSTGSVNRLYPIAERRIGIADEVRKETETIELPVLDS